MFSRRDRDGRRAIHDRPPNGLIHGLGCRPCPRLKRRSFRPQSMGSFCEVPSAASLCGAPDRWRHAGERLARHAQGREQVAARRPPRTSSPGPPRTSGSCDRTRSRGGVSVAHLTATEPLDGGHDGNVCVQIGQWHQGRHVRPPEPSQAEAAGAMLGRLHQAFDGSERAFRPSAATRHLPRLRSSAAICWGSRRQRAGRAAALSEAAP